MNNRWAEYYRAKQRAMLATADCFRIDPSHDSDEATRHKFIEDYERLAANYGRMAENEEDV
jgi:hypothetical protein